MRRPTGPGKVDLLPATPSGPDGEIRALLFNFDFDDATLKREHRDWLDENVVPALKSDPGALALINGTASRVGDAAYNRALSQRREEAVKQFLRAQGVSSDRLAASFTGADLSTSKVADDERDRAVTVALQVTDSGQIRIEAVLPAATNPRTPPLPQPRQNGFSLVSFRGAPGFKQALPPFPPFPPSPNLVGLPSSIDLIVNQPGVIKVTNGKGKTLVSSNLSMVKVFDPLTLPANAHFTDRVKVSLDPQFLSVLGLAVGQAGIGVTGPGVSPFQLGITVNVVAQVTVDFFFVDGPPGIRTTRTTADLDGLLKTMNDIYRGQTVIRFLKGNVTPSLKVKGLGSSGLNGVRVARRTTPDMTAIKGNRNASARFNVFFVGKFIDVGSLDSPENFGALTSRPPNDDPPLRCCIIRDAAADEGTVDFGQVLAHEAGHSLGEDDLDDSDLLMFKNTPSGKTIPSDGAKRMLDSFKAFPP